jgi:hypothetical protein
MLRAVSYSVFGSLSIILIFFHGAAFRRPEDSSGATGRFRSPAEAAARGPSKAED